MKTCQHCRHEYPENYFVSPEYCDICYFEIENDEMEIQEYYAECGCDSHGNPIY